MQEKNNRKHAVVSVRLADEFIERLDALCEQTSRTRGFYLRLAIETMVPVLEREHWHQRAAQFEEQTIETEFYRIMTAALDDKHES